jgi:hypothetical protein
MIYVECITGGSERNGDRLRQYRISTFIGFIFWSISMQQTIIIDEIDTIQFAIFNSRHAVHTSSNQYAQEPYISKSKHREKRLDCPVKALKWYVNKTQLLRGSTQQLFITSHIPYRPAAKSTLAGWLVDVISRSGALESPGKPRAHSVRALSASWAFARGLSLKEIVNTVSWRTDSTFTRVYMKDIGPRLDHARYASTVLGASSKVTKTT